MKHQVASLGGERTPHLKKNRTICRAFDRRDSQNARGQLDITIDARASGFHACSTGITDLAAEWALADLEGNIGSFRRCYSHASRTEQSDCTSMLLLQFIGINIDRSQIASIDQILRPQLI